MTRAHPKYGVWPSRRESLVVVAPGSIEGCMTLEVNVCQCGEVTDGVALNMGDTHNAGWVISFDDLERWYLANKTLRDEATKAGRQ